MGDMVRAKWFCNFFLHISFSWVEIRLHAEFQLPMLLRIGSFMVGDKKQTKTKTSFNEIKGFLSLQLELRIELGLGLRLTNK